MGNHSHRHDLPKERWFDALESTYGATMTDMDPRDGSHEAYSPGYRPDLVAFYRANSRKHLIADVKVVSPFTKSVTQQDAPRAAAVAFANTEEPLHERVLGRAAFVRGREGNFNRRQNTGSRVAVKSDYAGALRLEHTVIPVVHEVFGGWGRRAVIEVLPPARALPPGQAQPRALVMGLQLLDRVPCAAHIVRHPYACRRGDCHQPPPRAHWIPRTWPTHQT